MLRFRLPTVAAIATKRPSCPKCGTMMVLPSLMAPSTESGPLNTMPKDGLNPTDTRVGKRVRMRRMMLGLSRTKLGELIKPRTLMRQVVLFREVAQ